MLTLLTQENAEQRLTTFLTNLSKRCQSRDFSSNEFPLAMTRNEISNYIGLTVETISRILNRFNNKVNQT